MRVIYKTHPLDISGCVYYSIDVLDRLSKLKEKPYFTLAEARKEGVYPSLLQHYVQKNQIEKIGWGFYRHPDVDTGVDIQWEDLVLTAATLPNGVICLTSALGFYNLTDEIAREHWIAIPHSTTAPKREGVRFVRMRNTELGKESVQVGKITVQMFNRERTVIDSFRYLTKEIAIKALRAYLDNTPAKKIDLRKLGEYARILRTSIEPYLLTLTT